MKNDSLHILALESYDGGSHQQFLDGLIKHSQHQFTRLSMPARKWKWRMRGAAIHFAQQLEKITSLETIDLIFTSSMTAVSDLKSLLPPVLQNRPIVCYFHENQLTYPVEDETQRDYQYAFTQIMSCLASDRVWFNSAYHQDDFLNALDLLLKKMPDFIPERIREKIKSKSQILPLGLNPDCFVGSKASDIDVPVFVWNHRWEYDKNPDLFFETMIDLDKADFAFKLIILGEQFRTAPPVFGATQKILKDKIIHFGYAKNRSDYIRHLQAGTISISTSIHEFFGLAVLEAIAAGNVPLLPYRLSYPELIPRECHSQVFYHSENEFKEKVRGCLASPPGFSPVLLQHVKKYSWEHLIQRYDQEFENLVKIEN